MKKFNVKSAEKELLEINAQYKIKPKIAIQLITNNMLIYNQLLDDLESKPSNLYILYQMSSTIFKQLKEYKILPSDNSTDEVKAPEDDFMNLINTVKNKKDYEKR